jgi:hypothetical protein
MKSNELNEIKQRFILAIKTEASKSLSLLYKPTLVNEIERKLRRALNSKKINHRNDVLPDNIIKIGKELGF